MPGSETAATLGSRRSRLLRQRIADELTNARVGAGLSVREAARRVGIGQHRLERAEAGDANTLTIDLAARVAPVLGLQLAMSPHPNGDPVRDRAHLALLGRFRARLHRNLKWRTEVPMPITGDLRAGDGIVEGGFGTILVEAETRLTDLLAVERKVLLKARDLGVDRVIQLLADTANNRRVLDLYPKIRERFPVSQRRCLAALSRAADPGGNSIVIL